MREEMASAQESDLLTEKIIGFAIEVHRQLGPGLLESNNVYALSLVTPALASNARSRYPSFTNPYGSIAAIVSMLSSRTS